MKLRSTLLFAAASLTASALAPVVATTSAFFAASSVSAMADAAYTEGSKALVWGGDASGIWSTNTASTPWMDEEGNSSGFYDHDSVTFSTADANITVEGTVAPDAMNVTANTTLTGMGIVKMSDNLLSIADGKVLTLNEGVTLDFGLVLYESEADASIPVLDCANIAGNGTIVWGKFGEGMVGHGVSITLGDAFKGTLKLSGNIGTDGFVSLGGTSELILDGAWFYVTGEKAINIDTVVTDSSPLDSRAIGNGNRFYINGNGNLTFSELFDAEGKMIGFDSSGKTTFNGETKIGNIRQTGGTLEFNGLTTAIQYVGTSRNALPGALNIGSAGVLTITGSSNATGGNAGSFQVAHWNAKTTVNVNGVLNLQNAGMTTHHGTGDIYVKSGGEINFNAGLVAADVDGTQGSVLVDLVAGGRINVGSTGISSGAALALNLNGGTIGSLADSWSSDRALTLGGNVTFDTTKMNFNASGKATGTTAGSSVTLSGNISGDSGAIVVDGIGSLTLSGTNTYKGGTTVSAGTLVAGNASALGTGNFTLESGATLKVQNDVSLSLGGNTVLDGNVVLGNKAITNNGTLSVTKETVVFDIAGVTANEGVYTLITNGENGTISGWTSLTKDNFVKGGYTLGRGTFGVSNDGKMSFTAGALELTWNGTGVSAVWDREKTANWLSGNNAETFYFGDKVVFSNLAEVSKTVVVSGELLAGSITIQDAYTFNVNVAEGETASVAVAPSALTFDGENASLTLGTGTTLDLSSVAVAGLTQKSVNGSGTVKVSLTDEYKNTLTLNEAFSGTANITGGHFDITNSDIGTGTYVLDSGVNIQVSSTKTLANNITLGGTHELHTNGTNVLTLSGVIDGAGATLNKQGGGSLVFSGAETQINTLSHNAGTLTFNAGTTEIGSYKGTPAEGGVGTTVNIASGASVLVSGEFNFRNEFNGTSTLNLSGTLSVAGDLIISRDGHGIINIEDGGKLLSNKTFFGQGWNDGKTDKSSVINVKSGGLLVAKGLSAWSTPGNANATPGLNSSSLNLSGGTFATSEDSLVVSASVGTETLPIVLADGTTSTIDTRKYVDGIASDAETSTIAIANAISGAGSLAVAGAGTLTLSGNNSYEGTTTVNAGTLKATQAGALGSGAITVANDATLELGFGGTFDKNISGTGTLAKSGLGELTYTGAFGGSINVKEGLLTVDVADGSYKNLTVARGATFKAEQDASFGGELSGAGTLTGAKISVAGGAFAGTLVSGTLAKTGADTTLDLSGMKFGTFGTVLVNQGTVENLTLTSGGSLEIGTPTENTAIAFNNLVLSGGELLFDELVAGITTAKIDSLTVTAGAEIRLDAGSFISGENAPKYALFEFSNDAAKEWKDAFEGDSKTATLSLYNFAGGGTLSWDGNILYFQQTQSAEDLYWIATGPEAVGMGFWNDANWAKVSGGAEKIAYAPPPKSVIFDKNSLTVFEGEDYDMKTAWVLIRESVSAASVLVNVEDKDGVVVFSVEEGIELNVSGGITVRSGTLSWNVAQHVERTQGYGGAFVLEENGTLNVARSENLEMDNSFAGAGTIKYELSDYTLTLAGDRSDFTGTLDVDAGTAILINSTGTENFTIDIAGDTTDEEGNVIKGGTVIATGSAVVSNPAVDWDTYTTSSLSVKELKGAGTFIVKSQDSFGEKTFFTLKLTKTDDFTGKVQLDSLDLAVGKTTHFPNVSPSDIPENVTLVLNNASLNFFDEARTFSNAIEVTENGGTIRVYKDNTGATVAGDISGAGTLKIKDGGVAKLTGAVGTAGAALGGLTLSSGTLEISGENSSINVAGNVRLTGAATTINSTGTIGGNLVVGAKGIFNPMTLGGTLSIKGDWSLEATESAGRVSTILENAKIDVVGKIAFMDNEALTVGAGATLSAGTIETSSWGFRADLGANATLRADKATLNSTTITGSGESSRVEIGAEGLASNGLTVSNVTFAGLDGASWSTDAGLSLNGGTTAFNVVGENQTITVNGAIVEARPEATGTEGEDGYVAATSSVLKKTGAGTLVLAQANSNKGGVEIAQGTLRYTAADGITLGNTTYNFTGGVLQAGAGTTVNITSGTTLSGAVALASQNNSASINFADDVTIAGEGNSVSLIGNAKVTVAEGKTLTVGDLRFTENSDARIEGTGTLTLSGSVTASASGTISSLLGVSGTVTVDIAASKTLEIASRSSGDSSIAADSKITADSVLKKTGKGTLLFIGGLSEAYVGGIEVAEGTLESNRTLGGFSSLTIADGAIVDANVSNSATSTMTFGASTIDGNFTVGNAAMTFGGKLTVDGTLTWNSGNTAVLTDAFSKSIAGENNTLIDFDRAGDGLASVDFSNVLQNVEEYGRRKLSLTYNAANTSIDVISTGTLIWNKDVTTWTTATTEADWTFGNGTSAFQKNDYVEFLGIDEDAVDGAIRIADAEIYTSGVVFDTKSENKIFYVRANEEVKLNDADAGQNAGITVLSGNIWFEGNVHNEMKSGLYIYGGSLTLQSANSLGNGKVVLGEMGHDNAAKLVLNFTDEAVAQTILIGNKNAEISVGGGQDVTLSSALERDFVATTDADGTPMSVAAGFTGLTKTGEGNLTISRESDLNMLTVKEGTLTLSGDADVALAVQNVLVDSTLYVSNGGGEDGANAAFESVELVSGSMTVGDDGLGTYRAGTITSSSESPLLPSQLNGTLYIADGASTEINVTSERLNVSGAVAGAGTLKKTGAGTVVFSNSGDATFDIATGVVQEGGTVRFESAGNVAGVYTAKGTGLTLEASRGELVLGKGLTVSENSELAIVAGGSGTVTIEGGVAAEAAEVTVSGPNTVSFAGADAVAKFGVLSVGKLDAAGRVSSKAALTAEVIGIYNGSTLSLSNAENTAKCLVVGGDLATLNLKTGAVLKLDNTDSDYSVLQGAGTLAVTGGGTLSVTATGFNSGILFDPSIELSDGSTFNIAVKEEALLSLEKISTAAGETGTVSKTEAGTLVLADWSGEMLFDGTVALTEGTTEIWSKLTNATLEINSTLRFHGLVDFDEDLNPVVSPANASELAKTLSGTGTIEVGGALIADDLDGFTGTLSAGTSDAGAPGGVVYATKALETWTGSLKVQNGGVLATADKAVALMINPVALSGNGTFVGANADASLTVGSVDAAANSTLTLSGTGTLGVMTFEAAPDDNGNVVTVDGAWTLNGASTNLKKLVLDGGAVTVADAGALGEAVVAMRGENAASLTFAVDGTYENKFSLEGADELVLGKRYTRTITVDGVNVELSGTFDRARATSFDLTVAAKNTATLTIGDSVFASGSSTTTLLAESSADTITVNVTGAENLGETTLKGAGTVALNIAEGKTLTFNKDASVTLDNLEISGTGSANFTQESVLAKFSETSASGTLTVNANASATIENADLSDFTLAGAGEVEISGTEAKLAGMNGAKAVSLKGKVAVSGNISGSAIAFAAGNAELMTTGENLTVFGTKLSGETVTLNVDLGSANYNTMELSGTKSLVLKSGKSGLNVYKGTFALAGAYSGNLTKTGAGDWTIDGYKFGVVEGQTLTVENGTLGWASVELGTEAGTITIDELGTLQIQSLESGNAIEGTINGAGTLEISGTGADHQLSLETEVGAGATWGLKIAENSNVLISKALPGKLEVSGTGATAELKFDTDMSFEKKVLVGNHGTLIKTGDKTVTLADSAEVHEIHEIDVGTLRVDGGKWVQATENVRWTSSANVVLADGATFEVNVAKSVSGEISNGATISGNGDLAFTATGGQFYKLGNVKTFAGTATIARGAKVALDASLFADAQSVEVAEGAELEVRTSNGGDLSNVSGTGTLTIRSYGKGDQMFKARFSGVENFGGAATIKSGVLTVDSSEIDGLDSVSVAGESASSYYETEFGSSLSGAFLELENKTADSVADVNFGKVGLGADAGVIFDGNFRSANSFGSAKEQLFVAEAGTLSLGKNVDVNGSVFVAKGATFEIGRAMPASGIQPMAVSSGNGNNAISGDFTLNGELVCIVDDSTGDEPLLDVGGKTTIRTDSTAKKATIVLDLTDRTESTAGGIQIFNGYDFAEAKNINDYVDVETSTGDRIDIKVYRDGSVTVAGGEDDYTAPSGLADLYAVLNETDSTFAGILRTLGDASAKTEMLVELSPISFGSLLEMQSGFVALESELLAERLEQRRYERTVAGDRNTSFKAFVNVVGADREGDGDGTESANYDIKHTGLVGGFDVAVSDNTLVGMSLGFDWAEADVHGGAGTHKADTARIGVYGMSVFENAYLGYGLSVGSTSFDTERRYAGHTLSGEADGTDINASFIFGAGYMLDKTLGLDLSPYAGLDIGYASVDGFTEEGYADAALKLKKSDRMSVRGKIGATLNWRATDRLRLALDASFSHEFGDTEADLDASFAAGELAGTKFSSKAYLMDENTIRIGPRADFRIDDMWSVSAGYAYETDLDDTTTHSANIGFRARF